MSTLFRTRPHTVTDGHEPVVPSVRRWSRQDGRRWVRLLLTIMVLSMAITGFTCSDCWGDPRHLAINFGITFAYSMGLWLTNGYAVNWLDKYANWKREPMKRLVLTLLVSLGGSLAVIVLINAFILIVLSGKGPGVLLSTGVWRNFMLPLSITVICSLAMHSRAFLLGWREALVSNERLQKEMAQAEAETLRQQLDPHFMFNALNALTSLVEEEPKQAVRFIRQLSLVYRYVLDARGRDVVPLADELAFAESYLFLQRIRYGDALKVQMPAPHEVPPQVVVPPLSLQLLLENALKHNAASPEQPLHLRIELDETTRQLRVSNTLRPRRVAPGDSPGIGLANLTARYRHLTREPVQAAPHDQEFVVTLPMLELTT
ncbi:sensor histidine kinase [Hymenobacter koreensis]|uniref:Signal transduction histidine kinase internal region domain-containing protein n=1 Tax=Hymenobacter koreensis TaxID=1084523 RepID=A0ABP8J440_9BACT